MIPIVAIMYDFDKTLSPRDMQEYAFIPGVGMTGAEFWSKCNYIMRTNGMDSILAYMYHFQFQQTHRWKQPSSRSIQSVLLAPRLHLQG